MSNKSDGNQNTQSAKVLKLGLNISVSGDPGTDFEIVLDDNEQKSIQASPPKEEQLQCSDVLELEGSTTNAPKHELEKTNTREVKTHAKSTGAIPKHSNALKITHSPESGKMSESENSSPQDTSLIDRIKTTMENFEKFSDHIKDIPRLRGRPLATSTPFPDKYNSKSESSLVYPESRSRKFSHLYDFNSRKEYFKSSIKPSPPNLFLKPLPAENYYMRGIYTRFLDYEPQRHYGSDNSLNKTSEYKSFYGKSNYDVEKYEGFSLTAEPPSGILKKSDSECGDKQSTSSADSVKDIKIYQSGGILIMQNFKENMDVAEKKEISEFSAKLIENCNKLRMEVSGFQDDKPAIGNVTGEESKNSGKTVQFDLSSFESHKSKLGDSSSSPVKDESFVRMESSESASDCMKNKDTSPQGTSQSQDLTSLSTQENDSFMSNPAGTSPTYASSKKLEWDSGADVGYLNLDLSKENLSTIEKIVLKGLSSDGLSEENFVYEKKSNLKNRSKFTIERIPSSVMIEEMGDEPEIKSKEEGGTKKEKLFPEQENVFKSRDLREGETEKRKNTGKISSGENLKGDTRQKVEETKQSKNSAREIAATNETKPREKELELTDKSVNVNTLFDNLDWVTPPHQFIQGELIRPSESHVKPTHKRLAHSPKTKVSKTKSRPPSQRHSKVPKKPSIGSHITGPLVASYFDMGNPNKVYKNVEASPVLNEGELSREVDEIIIDQRFKIKQASGRETSKESDVPVKDGNPKEVKTKRPISASSSSNNTVLPKSESEEKTKKSEKYTDQMIQTSDRDCESVGVQAFASQVSSDCDLKSFRKNPSKAKVKENVNVSSKNIQAFGLNSSLPKQLENPTGTESIDKQNTKSTQFFGGPLNSLPNYHSNLVTKPGESCGRVPKVLKTKMNSEVIRMREENEKNILANDASKPGEPRGDSRQSKNNENKENLITQTNSRCQSNASHGKNSGTGSRDSEKKSNRKGRKTSVEGSDDVSSLVLTSEVLKVHGDSIDRNIIKEKYFQSQLVELEKREMISRSTSMEIQLESGAAGREYVTTGCQYSPQSRGTSEGQEPEDDSFKGEEKNRKRRARDGYVRQNAGERFGKNQDQNMETGDSLPSSTQTAHSWVPGMRNSRENSSGVGKARSFEYLPGHIYESSGNLREELPSETEKNLITSSSSESDTARGSVSNDGGRDSEGRKTLILENSTENSHDSEDRLKILDRNLSELSIAVLKLSKKDAQVEYMTRSLLANLCPNSGYGDWLPLDGADTSKTEVGDTTNNGKRQVGTLSEISAQAAKEDTIEKEEFSIACQTEEKSPSPDPEKFFEERKALEKRISEEKKCQIKWIENEIHHLNILRELLEKQSSPAQRKKKRSFLSTTSNDTSKTEENYPKNTEICPRPVTPVYGCTISVMENVPPESSRPATAQNCHQQGERESCPQYGLAVSLSGCSTNWRRVLMLPVGVQVSLQDTSEHCKDAEKNAQNDSAGTQFQTKNSPGNENMVKLREAPPCSVHTQFPTSRKNSANSPCTSVQTDVPPSKCIQCSGEQCYCLNLSDKSCTSSSRSKPFENRTSSKLHFIDEECDVEEANQTGSSLDPEILDADPVPTSKKIVNKNVSSPPDPCENLAKSKSIQDTTCKCQSIPNQVSPTVDKDTESYQGACQTHISGSSEELGSCRCPRVQITKSSNNCHIIKIHGSKCCSPQNNSCSLKRQSISRKTENQSCQTENEPVVVKDAIGYPKIARATEAPQVEGSYNVKVGIDGKLIVKKLPCSTKTPYQMIHSGPGTTVPEKLALEREVPEVERQKNVRTSVPTTPPENIPVRGKPTVPECTCSKKKEKVVDDHPRHYFLRIEEAEIDEPTEPNPRKKSLEVVTVTVPVKRAGKSKIYGSDVRQPRDSLRDKATGCSCCSGCSQNRRERTRDNEPWTGSSYQKIRAEKPSSPIRKTESGPIECDSFDDLNFYSTPCDDFYQQEPCPVPASYEERPVNGDYGFEECTCPNRNTSPSRETQNEYDSHKKAGNRFRGERSQRERPNGNRTLYDNRNGECVPSQVQSFNEGADDYDPEFYNYNKREFMTKSELLREEEKKRKVHQPSLQEYLTSNRPDFYNSAERRRQIISERANDRVRKHSNRMECLMKMIQQCNQQQQPSEPKRIFTTDQMRTQTMKRYRKLPEVTGKIADEKKKEEYRTNRLMADIFAKKLQNEALKGHINLSNSVSVLYTL